MLLKNLLVCTAICLVTAPASFAEPEKDADVQALKDIIGEFEKVFATRDKEALRRLYHDDGMYFQRTGREAFGKFAVADLMFAPRPSTAPATSSGNATSAGRPELVIDGAEADQKLGYIYGRVCREDVVGEQMCGTRWFLVTKKDENGKWKVLADMDMPLKETIRDENADTKQ